MRAVSIFDQRIGKEEEFRRAGKAINYMRAICHLLHFLSSFIYYRFLFFLLPYFPLTQHSTGKKQLDLKNTTQITFGGIGGGVSAMYFISYI